MDAETIKAYANGDYDSASPNDVDVDGMLDSMMGGRDVYGKDMPLHGTRAQKITKKNFPQELRDQGFVPSSTKKHGGGLEGIEKVVKVGFIERKVQREAIRRQQADERAARRVVAEKEEAAKPENQPPPPPPDAPMGVDRGVLWLRPNVGVPASVGLGRPISMARLRTAIQAGHDLRTLLARTMLNWKNDVDKMPEEPEHSSYTMYDAETGNEILYYNGITVGHLLNQLAACAAPRGGIVLAPLGAPFVPLNSHNTDVAAATPVAREYCPAPEAMHAAAASASPPAFIASPYFRGRLKGYFFGADAAKGGVGYHADTPPKTAAWVKAPKAGPYGPDLYDEAPSEAGPRPVAASPYPDWLVEGPPPCIDFEDEPDLKTACERATTLLQSRAPCVLRNTAFAEPLAEWRPSYLARHLRGKRCASHRCRRRASGYADFTYTSEEATRNRAAAAQGQEPRPSPYTAPTHGTRVRELGVEELCDKVSKPCSDGYAWYWQELIFARQKTFSADDDPDEDEPAFNERMPNWGDQQMQMDFMALDWEWLEELSEDTGCGKHVSSQLFVSSNGCRTGMHYDVTDNFYIQVRGRKRVLLASPAAWPYLYPYPLHHSLNRRSRVTASNPDVAKHPKFLKCRAMEVVLEPGDVLFIPAYWWHEVSSLDDACISLNCWHQFAHADSQDEAMLEQTRFPAAMVQRTTLRTHFENELVKMFAVSEVGSILATFVSVARVGEGFVCTFHELWWGLEEKWGHKIASFLTEAALAVRAAVADTKAEGYEMTHVPDEVIAFFADLYEGRFDGLELNEEGLLTPPPTADEKYLSFLY